MAQTDVFGIAALAQSYRQQNHKAAQGERVELRLHIDSDDAETDLIVEDMALYFQAPEDFESEYTGLLQYAREHVPPDRRVLDVGCLAGRVTEYFLVNQVCPKSSSEGEIHNDVERDEILEAS